MVKRSPFHPAVERAALPFADAIENPVRAEEPRAKAEPKSEAAGGNGATPRTKRTRTAALEPAQE